MAVKFGGKILTISWETLRSYKTKQSIPQILKQVHYTLTIFSISRKYSKSKTNRFQTFLFVFDQLKEDLHKAFENYFL